MQKKHFWIIPCRPTYFHARDKNTLYATVNFNVLTENLVVFTKRSTTDWQNINNKLSRKLRFECLVILCSLLLPVSIELCEILLRNATLERPLKYLPLFVGPKHHSWPLSTWVRTVSNGRDAIDVNLNASPTGLANMSQFPAFSHHFHEDSTRALGKWRRPLQTVIWEDY